MLESSASLVLVHCQSPTGEGERLRAKAESLAVETREFPGCHGIAIYQDESDADRFVIVEHWGSPADYDNYVRWRAKQGELDKFRALLAGPASTSFYRLLHTSMPLT